MPTVQLVMMLYLAVQNKGLSRELSTLDVQQSIIIIWIDFSHLFLNCHHKTPRSLVLWPHPQLKTYAEFSHSNQIQGLIKHTWFSMCLIQPWDKTYICPIKYTCSCLGRWIANWRAESQSGLSPNWMLEIVWKAQTIYNPLTISVATG